MNFSFWDTRSDFSLAEVKYLWERGERGQYIDPEEWHAMFGLLLRAIVNKRLPYSDAFPDLDSDASLNTNTDNLWRRVRVNRSDLKAWCDSEGLKPKFLFPEARRPVSIKAATAQAEMTPKERNVWAKLVKVLCMEAEIELVEPYKAAGIIRALTTKHRVENWPADDETIATKLKKAREAE